MKYNCRFCGIVEVEEVMVKKDGAVTVEGHCPKCKGFLLNVIRKDSKVVNEILKNDMKKGAL